MEWITLLILAAVLAWGVWTFNRFVRLRNQVKEAWAGIDVQLQRRYDLVPGLVATVKGYMKHESGVLERVTRLRENADYMRRELRGMGYDTMDSTTPVLPLLIGDDYKTIQYWRALLDAGVYVNPVMYPAVEEGHAVRRHGGRQR